MNTIWNINNFIAIYLNKLVLETHLEKIVWILADGPIFFIPIFFIWFWLYFNSKKDTNNKISLLNIFYSIILAMIWNTILKLFIVEKRPDTFIHPILSHVPDNSFPSDHATVSFAFLTWLYLFWFKKTFWVFLPFVILLNIARIAWWLHWFFDIIVWIIIWILWAILINIFKSSKIILNLNNFLLKIASFIKL